MRNCLFEGMREEWDGGYVVLSHENRCGLPRLALSFPDHHQCIGV